MAATNISLMTIKEDEQYVAPPAPPSVGYHQLPVNTPRADFLSDDRRREFVEICIPLYQASMTGDWKAAKIIIDKYPEVIRCGITENHETALHIAAASEKTNFVKNLVEVMTKNDLELQNKNKNTALCLAAAAGTVEIAKVMVDKNRLLAVIPGSQGMMPLYMAALFGKAEMVKYLYRESRKLSDDGWTLQNRGWLLLKCIEADIFDVALEILEFYPILGDDGSVLQVLAQKPDAFNGTDPDFFWRIINSISALLRLKVGRAEKKIHALEIVKFIWGRIVQKSKPQIDNMIRGPAVHKDGKLTYPSRMLFVAAEMGNTAFIIELIRYYPDLIWKVNDDNLSIFHVAVMHRHESIYNLLYQLGSMKDMITPLKDRNDNNMLHLVGKKPKKNQHQITSGLALQMQQELLWFQEVEQMIPPSYRLRKNRDGLTPYELFTKEHKDLVNMSEKWVKQTANECMVVATLIATIVFAAAFTVPGGYNQDNGIPMFRNKGIFIAYVVSDAISFFSSSTSIIMFLSILTSRYAGHHFLESIRKKLIIGLATLFLSITTMMIAFGISFFVLYHNKLAWLPFFICLFATLPVILFATLQYPLLADVFRSMYASRYLFKRTERSFYIQNPNF